MRTEELYKTTQSANEPRNHSVSKSVALRLPAAVAGKLRFETFPGLQRIDTAKRHELVLDPRFPWPSTCTPFPRFPAPSR